MKLAFVNGVRVRPKHEYATLGLDIRVGKIVKYEGEGFYIVELDGYPGSRWVLHEDDIELESASVTRADGQAERIHHLARRVRASMTALEAGLGSRTALGQDTAQTLALAAVELSNYCAIYDEVTRQNTPVGRKA